MTQPLNRAARLLSAIVDSSEDAIISNDLNGLVATCFLLAAAADTPDGLAVQSIAEIAEGTGLSWRTVHSALHGLDARRVLEIVSEEKERTLVRFPV